MAREVLELTGASISEELIIQDLRKTKSVEATVNRYFDNSIVMEIHEFSQDDGAALDETSASAGAKAPSRYASRTAYRPPVNLDESQEDADLPDVSPKGGCGFVWLWLLDPVLTPLTPFPLSLPLPPPFEMHSLVKYGISSSSARYGRAQQDKKSHGRSSTKTQYGSALLIDDGEDDFGASAAAEVRRPAASNPLQRTISDDDYSFSTSSAIAKESGGLGSKFSQAKGSGSGSSAQEKWSHRPAVSADAAADEEDEEIFDLTTKTAEDFAPKSSTSSYSSLQKPGHALGASRPGASHTSAANTSSTGEKRKAAGPLGDSDALLISTESDTENEESEGWGKGTGASKKPPRSISIQSLESTSETPTQIQDSQSQPCTDMESQDLDGESGRPKVCQRVGGWEEGGGSMFVRVRVRRRRNVQMDAVLMICPDSSVLRSTEARTIDRRGKGQARGGKSTTEGRACCRVAKEKGGERDREGY